ncbi:uncharacterized protein [Spinacia oleracea]|uniref:Endonuclease/exonuclease/phosphatase domain-containing protein n=1 Tax=Spinacia oleracea TaxID=3562 RepID=A0ABM3RJ71_SPIOL|nr:uncharacterized protein LOC110780653 [Spinacia oleracea]
MIICSWNVRGLNSPSKVVEVRRFLQKNNVDVVALVETRVRENNVKKVQTKLGGECKWEMNYSYSPKGRIWVGWGHSLITYQVVNKTDQFIHGVICTKTGLTNFEFTALYGLHTIDHRKSLWVYLVNTAGTVSKPWLLMMDFNSVLYSGDMINGNQVQDSETRDFEGCIDTAGLTELKSCGHYFSWSNKGQGLSDHSPLVLTCNLEDHSKGRPFRFFNYMADHPSFNQVVQDGWKVNIQGTAMHQVWQKLKCVKKGLKTLHKKEFARLEERIDTIRTDLDGIQLQLAASPTDTELQVNEKRQTELHKKVSRDSGKCIKTKIKNSVVENRKLVTTEEIQKEICDFYKELVGSASDNLVGIDLDVVRKGSQLTADAAQGLVVPVTNDEIDVALAVKDDIYAAVKEFFDTGKMLRQVNNTSVTLIPKIQNATTRMQGVIGDMISNAQSGFIPGRNISDNILLASELVKCYSRKYISPRCMIKVDLKKAYDSIEWPFLKQMLQELGFLSKFVH